MFRPASKVAPLALSCPLDLGAHEVRLAREACAARKRQAQPDREAVHVQAGLEGRVTRMELPVDLGEDEVHLACERRAARNELPADLGEVHV
jgi:hypothetical protein